MRNTSWVIDLAAAALLSAPAAASDLPGTPGVADRGWRFAAWAGRTDAAPPSLASELRAAGAAEATAFTAGSGGSASPVYAGAASALEFCAEAGFAPGEARDLGLAVRAGALLPDASAVTMSGRGAAGDAAESTLTVRPRLYPFLLGVWSEGGQPAGFRLRGACFLGTAYVRAAVARDVHLTAADGTESRRSGAATWAGWAPLVAEFDAEVSYPLGRGLALSAEAGVRLATVPRLAYAADADLDGDGTRDVRLGSRVTGSDGKDFRLDFGGTFLRAGLKLAL